MAGECSGRGHDKRSQGRKSSEGLETRALFSYIDLK